VIGRQHRHQRLGTELLCHPFTATGKRRAHDHCIELTVIQAPDQGFTAIFDQLHLHCRMRPLEAAHQRGDHLVVGCRFGQPQCQRADLAAGGAQCLFLGLVDAREDVLRRFPEHPPGIAEHDAASLAMKQRRSDLFLQCTDLLPQRRLGNVQGFGGPGEALQLGGHDEVAQVAQFHWNLRRSDAVRTRYWTVAGGDNIIGIPRQMSICKGDHMKKTRQLRNLLGHGRSVIAPGVFDGLSARLVELAGFEAVYASGGAIARSAGMPDIGLLGFTEVLAQIERIVDACDLPVVADADTGFGSTANVERTVRAFERAGVAALHIEDQTFPKRCGHLDDKTLVDTGEMCTKIRVACEARRDPELMIIARTDAIACEGLDAAIGRAQAYVDAGADMIFVEAPETLEQIEAISQRVPGPKLINMFHSGKTPLVPVERLAELDYRLVIIPSDLQRAAIRAMQRTLQEIAASGDSRRIAGELVSFGERETIVRTARYLALDRV